jgi:tetratricopeptide (TPR) repeat protein
LDFLELRADLQGHPDDPNLTLELGNLYFARRKWQEASLEYEKSLAAKPDFFEAEFNTAAVCACLGEWDLMSDRALKLLGRAPRYNELYLALGRACRGQGKLEEAAGGYARALDHDMNLFPASFSLAELSLMQNPRDVNPALLETSRGLAVKPDSFSGHFLLAELYSLKQVHNSAEREFKIALAMRPESREASLGLADALLAMGQEEQSREEAARAIQALRLPSLEKSNVPEDLAVHPALLDRAIARARALIRLLPNRWEPAMLAALLLEKKKRLDEALDLYSKALALGGENPDVLLRLGKLNQKLGRISRAIEFYIPYLKRRPKDMEIRIIVGKGLLRLGNVQDALKHLEEALKLAPHDHELRLTLGNAYEKVGNIREAEKIYREILLESPDFKRADTAYQRVLKILGWREFFDRGVDLFARNRLDEAIVQWKFGLTLQNTAILHACLGKAHFAKGQIVEAIEENEIALSLEPENREVAREFKASLEKVRAKIREEEKKAQLWLDGLEIESPYLTVSKEIEKALVGISFVEEPEAPPRVDTLEAKPKAPRKVLELSRPEKKPVIGVWSPPRRRAEEKEGSLSPEQAVDAVPPKIPSADIPEEPGRAADLKDEKALPPEKSEAHEDETARPLESGEQDTVLPAGAPVEKTSLAAQVQGEATLPADRTERPSEEPAPCIEKAPPGPEKTGPHKKKAVDEKKKAVTREEVTSLLREIPNVTMLGPMEDPRLLEAHIAAAQRTSPPADTEEASDLIAVEGTPIEEFAEVISQSAILEASPEDGEIPDQALETLQEPLFVPESEEAVQSAAEPEIEEEEEVPLPPLSVFVESMPSVGSVRARLDILREDRDFLAPPQEIPSSFKVTSESSKLSAFSDWIEQSLKEKVEEISSVALVEEREIKVSEIAKKKAQEEKEAKAQPIKPAAPQPQAAPGGNAWWAATTVIIEPKRAKRTYALAWMQGLFWALTTGWYASLLLLEVYRVPVQMALLLGFTVTFVPGLILGTFIELETWFDWKAGVLSALVLGPVMAWWLLDFSAWNQRIGIATSLISMFMLGGVLRYFIIPHQRT